MAAMGENGVRRLAVMVMTLILLAAAVAQADTDCSRKCVRQCRDSLFPTICRQGCLKKCKHSFSAVHLVAHNQSAPTLALVYDLTLSHYIYPHVCVN